MFKITLGSNLQGTTEVLILLVQKHGLKCFSRSLVCVQNTLGIHRTNASNTGAGIHDYCSSCQLRLEEISGMLAHMPPLLFPCFLNKINLTPKAEVVFQGT